MTSKWSIKDESGRVVLIFTMVMGVSSEGITKIAKYLLNNEGVAV